MGESQPTPTTVEQVGEKGRQTGKEGDALNISKEWQQYVCFQHIHVGGTHTQHTWKDPAGGLEADDNTTKMGSLGKEAVRPPGSRIPMVHSHWAEERLQGGLSVRHYIMRVLLYQYVISHYKPTGGG